jgi:rhodanese-related sulfurtransferase
MTDGHATVDRLLAEARAEIRRMEPRDAHEAMGRGAILIDIRAGEERESEGAVPGAWVVPRNALEWRLDPACEHRNPELARRDVSLIVMCDEGYQSSLAVATVSRFGLDVSDLAGGFQGWRAAGLPVTPPPQRP